MLIGLRVLILRVSCLGSGSIRLRGSGFKV